MTTTARLSLRTGTLALAALLSATAAAYAQEADGARAQQTGEARAQEAPAPTLEEVVNRIERRLEAEVASRPPAARSQRVTHDAERPRINLNWRSSLVWPVALVGSPLEASAEARPRIRLVWDEPLDAPGPERPRAAQPADATTIR